MHRTILSLAPFLAVFGLIFIFNGSPAFGQKHPFQVVKIYRPLTQKLPSIDRVELLKLEEHADLRSGGIISIKTPKGIKAKNLAALWRSQKYGPGLSACHNAIYGVKFYSGRKLIVYASVCWDCNMMGFEKPYINDTQYFYGKSRKGQQLLKIFQVAFPENN